MYISSDMLDRTVVEAREEAIRGDEDLQVEPTSARQTFP